MHSFLVYKWPIPLLKELEAYIRIFLWTRSILKRSHTSVSWKLCCTNHNNVSLNFRSLRHLNEAMLAKLPFKIITEDDLVHHLLKSCFLHKGSVMKFPLHCSIWLSIKSNLTFVLRSSQWIPGFQSNLSFWYDNWLGYRIIDVISMHQVCKKSLVQKVGYFFVEGKQIESLPSCLPDFVKHDIGLLKFGFKDVFVCKIAKEEKPTSKDFYKAFSSEMDEMAWEKEIWKHFIPHFRSFVLWRYLHRRTSVEAMFK